MCCVFWAELAQELFFALSFVSSRQISIAVVLLGVLYREDSPGVKQIHSELS